MSERQADNEKCVIAVLKLKILFVGRLPDKDVHLQICTLVGEIPHPNSKSFCQTFEELSCAPTVIQMDLLARLI